MGLAAPSNLITAEVTQNGVVASSGSNGRKFAFVWHFRRIAFSVNPSEVAVANAFMTSIGSLVMAALNVRATMQNVSVRFMEDPTNRAVFTTDTTAGAITGDSMVMDDAAYLMMNSNLRGQTYQGSKHLFPMSESDTTTNSDIWNSGCLTRLGAIATAALAGFTDSTPNTWKLCIYSRKLSNPIRTPLALIVTNDVATISVRKSIGDMKHRRPGSVY